MNVLLQVKRSTGLYPVELAEMLNTDVPTVEAWLVDDSTIDEVAEERLFEEFRYATDWLDGLNLTWDQVKSLRQVSRQLFVTTRTLEVLLTQRKIKPLDFGVLGLWLTDEQVQACRKLP
jgi:hypothetical protein